MPVALNAELCIGSGSCEDLAPQVFQMGDEGVVTVVDPNPPSDLVEAVEQAALNCPTAAITVTD